MAINIFERLLDLVGSKPAEARHDYPVYTKHPSGLSGVERYLQKQVAIAEQEAARKATTGVERYLAKQAAQAAEQSGATGVEKYLAKHGDVSEAATGVDRYLAKQGSATVKKKTERITVLEEALEAKKVEPVAKEPVSQEKAPPKPAGMVKLSEDATQCQATTTKGTRCSRTYGLTHIQRTISKQKYQFTACSQHKDETFKPYPGLLESQ